MSDSLPINYHVIELKITEGLSERAKNICIENGLESLYKIIEYYLEFGNFNDLRNCGIKTNEELIALSKKYMDKYPLTAESLHVNEHHRTFEEYKMFCFEQFSMNSHEAEVFRHAFLEERFPFFQFILVVLQKLLSDREYYIFERNFGYFKDKKKLTLQAIGNNYKITRERIRQIAQDIPFKIRNILSPFADELFFIENHIQYNLKRFKDIVLINSETADEINQQEELNCTPRFYALGFSILYHNDLYFFQEPSFNYKQYYLVNRKLAEQFDFAEFYYSLSEKAQERVKRTYTVDFRHFVRSFYRPGKFSYFERIVEVCKQIASGEFGFKCNINDQLIIERNTKVRLSEHIVQVLAERGRPMHLKEIAAELKSRNLKTSPSIESLRSSILTIDQIRAIGKTSTYSLVEWDQVKTGTIKQLAKEYLDQLEHPAHIAELAKYINKHRKTLDKNVYSNLKLDKTGTFAFFKGGFIGLSSKNYSSMGSTNGQLSLL